MTSDTAKKRSGPSLPFILFFLVVIAVAAYCGYWVWMSGEVKKGADQWVQDQRDAGMTVEYSSLKVGGFPFRFVLEEKDQMIAKPDVNYRWEGEQLQLIAQTWNLNHILVRSPGENFTRLPNGEGVVLTPGDKSIASLRFSDGYVKNFGVQFPELTGRFDNGDEFELTDLIIGLAPKGDAPDDVKFRVTLGELKLPSTLPAAEWLGRDVENFVIMAEIEHFYPVVEGRMSVTEWRVDRSKIKLLIGEILMGPLKLAAKSNITLDRDFNPDGTVGINLQQVTELKDALYAEGVLTPDVEQAINSVNALSQNGAFATVKVENRTVSLLGNELFRY